MNQVPLQPRRRLWVAGTTLTAVAAALATVFMLQAGPAVATPSPAASVPIGVRDGLSCRPRYSPEVQPPPWHATGKSAEPLNP